MKGVHVLGFNRVKTIAAVVATKVRFERWSALDHDQQVSTEVLQCNANLTHFQPFLKC